MGFLGEIWLLSLTFWLHSGCMIYVCLCKMSVGSCRKHVCRKDVRKSIPLDIICADLCIFSCTITSLAEQFSVKTFLLADRDMNRMFFSQNRVAAIVSFWLISQLTESCAAIYFDKWSIMQFYPANYCLFFSFMTVNRLWDFIHASAMAKQTAIFCMNHFDLYWNIQSTP